LPLWKYFHNGKTWTGLHHAQSVVDISDAVVRAQIDIDPAFVLTGQKPLLVDEWQDAPVLWDKARRIIDDEHDTGLFIFTGSAVPAKEQPVHSGTGRFMHLHMRPMSSYETDDSTGAVSLQELFAGATIASTRSEMDFKKAAWLICRGGWPASLWLDDSQKLLIPKGYITMLAESDISRADGIPRDRQKVALVLRSLARNTATNARLSVLHNDVSTHEGDQQLSIDSIRAYLAALRQIFVIEELPAWLPSLESKRRIRTTPKRYFIDPSLAAAALGATPELLLQDPMTAGLLFETLCVRDLLVYAESFGGTVAYYRDDSGLEADVIVQCADGRWCAIEIKLGAGQIEAASQNLIDLQKKLAGETQAPSFLMAITGAGGMAYTRSDGVHVVPLDCLRP
jgi:predicted AAA+ superfamily ATPase